MGRLAEEVRRASGEQSPSEHRSRGLASSSHLADVSTPPAAPAALELEPTPEPPAPAEAAPVAETPPPAPAAPAPTEPVHAESEEFKGELFSRKAALQAEEKTPATPPVAEKSPPPATAPVRSTATPKPAAPAVHKKISPEGVVITMAPGIPGRHGHEVLGVVSAQSLVYLSPETLPRASGPMAGSGAGDAIDNAFNAALGELRKRATALGADAVISVSVAYCPGVGGGLLVAVTGTAVHLT